MTIKEEIDNFFNKYGETYNTNTINYTKQLVEKIKSSNILKGFLIDNKITASVLLNEIVPYSDYKFQKYGDEKLNMQEIQSVLSIIILSNELETLIMDDHVNISSIGPTGELYYTPDQYAVDYFIEKYGLELKANEEFDFTVLDDINLGEDDNNMGDFDFGIN